MENMLDKKVKHGKLKEKAPKIPDYLSFLHNVKQPPCFVCNIHLGIQMHHIKKNSSDYRDDSKVIPLCFEHHHGTELSPHGTPVLFRDVFPMNEQEEYAKELYQSYKGDMNGK